MLGHLQVVAGPDQGRAFPLENGQTLLIGRGQNTGTQLKDLHVSRVHCELQVAGDKFRLIDNGSRPGRQVPGHGLLRMARGLLDKVDPTVSTLPRSGEANMTEKIHRRDDVNPERGEHEHGDVEFADPVNNKYPIDTAEHVRSAWSYINHADNASKYKKDEVETIKGRIKRAAKKHGVEIHTE